MRRLGFLLFFLHLYVSGQNSSLINDLQSFKETLLSKNELFHSYSKKDFSKRIDALKKDSLDRLIYWKLKSELSKFKEIDLSIHSTIENLSLFKIKSFNDSFHLTQLPIENHAYLGYEIIEINDLNLKEIRKKMKAKFSFLHNNQLDKFCVEYLGNIDFLAFTGINSAKEIKIKVKNKDEVKELFIPLTKTDLVALETAKKAFYQKYENRPFWQYGINFGKQIFFKLTASLTKEERVYLQDSLELKPKEISKLFQLPLQQVFEAKTMNYNKEKLTEKLDKKRYKQVFLDLRDFKTGTDFVFKSVLKEIIKNKRFKKKNRCYIFTNKNTSNSVVPLLHYLQKETKCIIIGTSVFGSTNSITQKEIVNLPSINSYLLIPKKIKKPILINADEVFETNFHQYKNGVDALLQKVLQ